MWRIARSSSSFDLRYSDNAFLPANVKAAAAFGAAIPRAVALLRRLHPRVVVSVGGYASVPPVVAAKALGIPIVVLSYDAVPGAAARSEALRTKSDPPPVRKTAPS